MRDAIPALQPAGHDVPVVVREDHEAQQLLLAPNALARTLARRHLLFLHDLRH